jgi:EAL domain-containing protein (putative c-di-GMP-specific phosphodiesterase class I)
LLLAILLTAAGPWLPGPVEVAFEVAACLAGAVAGVVALRSFSPALRWPWMAITVALLALVGRGISFGFPSVFNELIGYVSLALGYGLLAVAFVRLAAGASVGWNGPAALDTAVALCGLVGSSVILQIGQYASVDPASSAKPAMGLFIAFAGVLFTAAVLYGALARRSVPVFYQRLLVGALLVTVLGLLLGVTGPQSDRDSDQGALTLITLTALALLSALRAPDLAHVGEAVHSDEVAWSLPRVSGLLAISTLAVVAAVARVFTTSPRGVFVLVCLFLIILLLLTRSSFAILAQRRLLRAQRVTMTTDDTTGLPNSLGLLAATQQGNGDQARVLVRVWLADLDDIRDTAGRSFADSVECSWATELAARLPTSADVCRVAAGDYALVVTADAAVPVQDPTSVRAQIGSLAPQSVTVHALADPVHIRTDTAAAALAGPTREDFDEALALAALARRDLTHSGGIGSTDLREAWAMRTELGQQLLADRCWAGLSLQVQPFVRIEDEAVIGYECLARWVSPTRGLIMPGQFLPIAEALSLMGSLDCAVIGSGLSWRGPTGGAAGILSLNVDPHSLLDDRVVSTLLAAAGSPGWTEAELWLEVLENDVDILSDDIAERLAVMAQAGYRIAIDDFAAGASTLSRLDRLQASVLKLDRALIDGIDRDRRKRAIVAGVVGIAEDLDVLLVAEGIERVGERDVLRDLGCPLGQGYLWARPGPVSEALPPGHRIAVDGGVLEQG